MNGGEVIFKFLGDDKGLKSTMGKLGSIGATALKGLAAGTTAVATGFTALVTSSIKARGEMEQSLGGVETIFKKGADTIIANANRAYKESGISAQQYMDQATSFGASLRRSLGDNDKEIAKYVDMAIKDMADNSAKMGTSIEQIQNAYQGLAKGNATMLDNLKVGYGGTQKEMLQLAKDMKVVNKNMKSFNEMSFDQAILAIHKVQEKLELTGTAAKEATETLTGSIGMLKASWSNFLSGQGGLDAVVESAGIAFKKIIEVAQEAIPAIATQLRENLPQLVSLGRELIGTITDGIMLVLPDLMITAGQILMAITDGIIDCLPQILDTAMIIIDRLSDGLLANSDKLGEISAKLIIVLAKGLIASIPHLIEAAGKIMGALILGITKANGDLWVAGFEAFLNFIDGVKATIERVKKIATLIKNIIELAINELKRSAYSWGVDFLSNFASGIMSRIHQLSDVVSNVANRIRSKLHFSRPDEGPLRDYETWMPDMIKGMAKSLNGAMPILDKEINKLTSQMAWGLSPTLNAGAYSYSPSVNVDVHNNMTMDPLGQMVNQVKTFSNGAKNDYNYGYGG